MASLMFVSAILPGKGEALRRLYQELAGSRQAEYELSRRQLSITGEFVWVSQLCQGEIAIVSLETASPEQVILQMATSELPFDRWFRLQLREFYGFDLARLKEASGTELIFTWHAA